MESDKTINRVIPEGEMNCIWVEAGLVSYKLCDRNYECEDCPFDQVMRQQFRPASRSPLPRESGSKEVEPVEKSLTNHEMLVDLINGFFAAPLSVLLPIDRTYLRNHIWLMRVEKNVYRFGIDHYAAVFLESIGSIVLPQRGMVSVQNNPLVWIICEDGTIAVRSPLGGKVVKSNSQLKDSAFLINKDPYGSGWMSEIEVEEQESPPRDSWDAKDVEKEYREQLVQSKRDLISELDRKPSLGITLMDGGTRPRSLKDVLGTRRFVAFLQNLLSVRI